MLAEEIANQSRSLQNQLNRSRQLLSDGNTVASVAEASLGQASGRLADSEQLQNDAEGTMAASNASLGALNERLAGLEVLIQQNEAELEVARDLADLAVESADDVSMVGAEDIE